MTLDDQASELLARFEGRADEVAGEIAAANVEEVEGFRGMSDGMVYEEIRALARAHLDAFLESMRTGRPPSDAVLAAARGRAVQRARELVPLAAVVHAYLIAQRVISAAIARVADPDARSREAALALTAMTFDYSIAVTAAVAEAYVEVVQGDLADLDVARRGLIDTLLTRDAARGSALERRAMGLGFDVESELVVVVAVVARLDDREPGSPPPRWAAQAIARCSGRPERSVFVVSREGDLVAVLHARGGQEPRVVLERAAAAIGQAHRASLRAGVGTPFSGFRGFADSYREATRALRHASLRQPFVFGPDDIGLFAELTNSGEDEAHTLIPEATRQVLADAGFRRTVEAFFAADLQVSVAARSLDLHPNSLRYRLGRIATLTGRDPRRLVDLLELITAARLIAGHGTGGGLTLEARERA
jgi:GGDEF-like domain/PucR C-terminal helix-turn-helix domain